MIGNTALRAAAAAAVVTLALASAAGALGAPGRPGSAPPPDWRGLLEDGMKIPSTTGNEQDWGRRVAEALAGAGPVRTDALGTVIVGNGRPRGLAIVAGLDQWGWIVSGITADGYLRLDRPVPAPSSRFDAFLLGRPVAIATRIGVMPGVVSQPAIHLLTPERRRLLVDGFTLEDAYVDIAARSDAEVKERGIAVLDAVVWLPELQPLAGGRLAGPGLAGKACAAVLAAGVKTNGPSHPSPRLSSEQGGGTEAEGITIAFAAQTKFLARGAGTRMSLGAVRVRNLLDPASVILVEPLSEAGDETAPRLGLGPIVAAPKGATSSLAERVSAAAKSAGVRIQAAAEISSATMSSFAAGKADVVVLGLPTRYLDTPDEMIDSADAEALVKILRTILAGGAR